MNMKQRRELLNVQIGTERDFEKTYEEPLAEFEKTEFWFSVKDYPEGKEFMDELKACGKSKIVIGYGRSGGLVLEAEMNGDMIKYYTYHVEKFDDDIKRYNKEV